MAFDFKDLSITLSTSTGPNGPKAVAAVAAMEGCGPQSLVVNMGTCGVRTQNPCDTNPDNIGVEDILSGINDVNQLRQLREALDELLARVGPALEEFEKSLIPPQDEDV